MRSNTLIALFLCAALATAAQTQTPPKPAWKGQQAAVAKSLANKPLDTKQARAAYKRGLEAEKEGNWLMAFAAYSEAVRQDSTSREYLLRREIARGKVVGEEVDRAEQDALVDNLGEARNELHAALRLDPGDEMVRERLAQLAPSSTELLRNLMLEPAGEVRLKPQTGTRSFDFRGDTASAYEEVAREFGVEASFDAELQSRPVRLKIENVDFETAMRVLGDMTVTFWRPLTSRLFFVAADTPEKRRAYDLSVVRTVQLPNAETNDEMTQELRLVREMAGIRAELNLASRTITMRASPQAVSVAAQLLDQLEQPHGEVVLEMELLEVDRTAATELGITPPQTAQVFTLSAQEIQEAQEGAAGLVSVIQQLFGSGSSLSGLGSLIPPLVAFGGGNSRFLATLPGAAAAFSETLNTVRTGERVLLRAQDGKPATFFVGERVPVDLAQYSSGLTTPEFIAGSSSSLFPESTIATGQQPVAVISADFTLNGNIDLAVANQASNTVSIFLGNGNGTFSSAETLTTGNGPVALVTADFNGDGIPDLAVLNQTDNTVSIFLGNGDGTFALKGTFATGKNPVAIASGPFTSTGYNDLAVVNQGENTVSILLGNGDGTFQTQTKFATGAGPSAITTTSFTSDGNVDLAVTNQTANTVSVFLGNGNGTFSNSTTLATGHTPVALAAAQFDLDNSTNTDLAIVNQGDDTLLVYLGNGDGTFALGSTFVLNNASASGNKPVAITEADFNADGFPDLAVTDEDADTVSILIGNGDGTFATPLILPAGSEPIGLASGAFLGSTSPPDLAIADSAANELTIIQNDATFSPTGAGSVASTPYPSAEYEDVGLKIKATPYIQAGGDITLDLHFELRSLTAATLNGIPVISNETVEQTVSSKAGQTTALAGIIESTEMRAINGTPGAELLGPLSLAASSSNTQNSSTELLILLTPRVVQWTPETGKPIYAGRLPATGGAFPGFRPVP
ncbi:MAG: FG-GAP-like repeat-containing protein [Candidatus Acidiferrales bacterium]